LHDIEGADKVGENRTPPNMEQEQPVDPAASRAADGICEVADTATSKQLELISQ